MYLRHLRDLGLTIDEAVAPDSEDWESAPGIERTYAAMKEGVAIIYQAALADATWSGRADFLCRVDSPSGLGGWSYEVIETKLARDTRAGTILQLSVYSDLLEKVQGVRPKYMYVVTPGTGFEPTRYRVDDYAAYSRLLKRRIDDFIAHPSDTYPELVEHCHYCAWWAGCEQRRRDDDHLCYVAGISRSQIETLAGLGIGRLAELAGLEPVPRLSSGSQEAMIRVRDQARVQLLGRDRGAPHHELKQPFDQVHGLALLPEPCQDDIFLDLEGNHFAENGVHEYLIGYVMRGARGEPVYTPIWATTPEEERAAFERFMDLVTETRRQNPDAHLYHFAPYEPAALKRLMGRYAIREVQLDELLRGHAFVDLYAVVRRSLIASVERYSVKDLEPFFGYEREQDLGEATLSRRILENAIETGDIDDRLGPHRRIVEDYNREDCESILRLREWLEKLRSEVIAEGHELPRPPQASGEASEKVSDLDRELQRLRDGLLEGVSADPDGRQPEEQARYLLAHLMEFHRREDKASWWEYFRVLALEEDQYEEERRAVTGLRFTEELEAGRAPLHRYRFPSQELDARPGDDLRDVVGKRFGKVVEVNYAERRIDIKKRRDTAHTHPHSLLLHNQVSAEVLRKSLMRFGERVLVEGFTDQPPYRAGSELLLRRPSPLVGANGALQRVGETTVQAACRLVEDLDGEVLAIQGPPGTGKTYTGAQMICALKRRGLKVGVTAVSHKVIVNLLEAAKEEADRQGLRVRAVHRGEYEGNWDIERRSDYDSVRLGLGSGEIDLLGATAWCWSREDFEQSVDVLFVDEAGQMSLGNVLAAAPGGRSLVLLGDPQQLEQPLQSSHPEGSEASALYHLLAGEETMPADKGLFLERTYRLHPDIARFTSEIYYEGRVRAPPELARQALLPAGETRLSGSGLRYVAVEHAGNQARSLEEVEAIRLLVAELLSGAQLAR